MRFKEAQTRFFPDPMPSVPDTSKKVKSILDPFIDNCPEIVNESIFQPLNYINPMNPYVLDVVEGRFQNMFMKIRHKRIFPPQTIFHQSHVNFL